MGIQSEDRNSQHESILNSACILFAKYGFEKTTMVDIARGAGLKKPSVYYYFGSKEEIFSAVVSRESNDLLTLMRRAAERANSVKDKLSAIFIERYRYMREKKILYSISNERLDEVSSLVQQARNDFTKHEMEFLLSIIEYGMNKGEIEIENPRLFSLVAIASLQGIDNTFLRQGQEDQIEAGLKMMMDIFYKGVCKEKTQ